MAGEDNGTRTNAAGGRIAVDNVNLVEFVRSGLYQDGFHSEDVLAGEIVVEEVIEFKGLELPERADRNQFGAF